MIGRAENDPSGNGIPADLPPDEVIFGRSEAMQAVRKEVEQTSRTDLPTLIEGESGCGKEVMARLIHHWSPRREDPFVRVQCPALLLSLLESELPARGNGANVHSGDASLWPLEAAPAGTLYLHEILELEPPLQGSLLRFLRQAGSSEDGPGEPRAGMRLISSSRANIRERLDSGAFRPDLFYRINVIHLRIPPLRNRAGDIPQLVDYLLQVCRGKFNAGACSFPANLLKLFQTYHWPGNIRQLESAVKRYVITGSEDAVSAELLDHASLGITAPVSSSSGSVPLRKLMREVVRESERRIILQALYNHHWDRKETARALGISYQALLSKMRQASLSYSRPV